MKVLFQNRPDALTRWGGDTTQMMKTKQVLETLGAEVRVDLSTEPALQDVDIVHVFNVQTAVHSAAQVRHAKSQGLPVVLSPIFWDKRHIETDPRTYQFHDSSWVRRLAAIHPWLPSTYFRKLSPKRRAIRSDIVDMLDQADSLLPNSIAELEVLSLLFDRPGLRAKSHVVVNAIDARPANTNMDTPVIESLPKDEFVLQVGRFEPIKGQMDLISALLTHPEIPLVFIGGAMDSLYGQACQRLGQQRGNTHFISHVPHESLPAAYRRARVHALPSLRESPGLVTLEAAVQGANCVVSIHGPILEYFGDMVWCCDPASPASIERAILSAWRSPRDGKLGHHVMNTFTWQKAGQQTMSAYESLRTRRT